MAERFIGSALNAPPHSRERQTQITDSPSLASDILSGSGLPSSLVEFDGDGSGWVLFSPQIIPENERESDNRLRAEPLETLEPLDLTQSAATTRSANSAHEEAAGESSLEFPTHNGTGAFSTPSSSRLELFERVNAWRMEQSELLGDDMEGSHRKNRYSDATLWQKLKQSASRGIDRYFAWDDETIDALFSKDFRRRQQNGTGYHPNHHQRQHSVSSAHGSEIPFRLHYSRAQKYGPPDWEDRILRRTLYRNRHEPGTNQGLLVAVLSRILMWSAANEHHSNEHQREDSQRRTSTNSALDHADHSYHMDAIQGSIATVTSTMTAAPWSDTWDTATTTSLGVAAA